MSSDGKTEKKLPPNQRPISRILRWGIDHPGISPTTPHINLDSYKLIIDGEVDNPVGLIWDQILQLPKKISVSDFHCVEGWSVFDCHWEGILLKDLEELVKPKPTAKAVTFECADSYSTSLFREELSGDDVLLAFKLNGVDLAEGYGFPLRLIVPSKYAYKSALWVIHVKFTAAKELGFWERRGYSDNADVWKNNRFR